MGSRNSTIAQIAAWISWLGRLDRTLVDQTGLSGTAQPDVPGTTLLEALQEQLGLKLKPTTAALDTLVIDHVELPSEN